MSRLKVNSGIPELLEIDKEEPNSWKRLLRLVDHHSPAVKVAVKVVVAHQKRLQLGVPPRPRSEVDARAPIIAKDIAAEVFVTVMHSKGQIEVGYINGLTIVPIIH